MHYETVNLPEMKIAGLSARTSNLDPEMGRIIGSLWNSFFAQGGPQAVPNRMGEHVYGLYSDYENDYRARYDITVGCRVQDADGLPQQIAVKTVPAGNTPYLLYQAETQPLWQRPGKKFGAWSSVGRIRAILSNILHHQTEKHRKYPYTSP